MGLFGNSNADDLEARVARLEAQVAALMPLLDIDQTPTTWQQQDAQPAHVNLDHVAVTVEVHVPNLRCNE